ncbi:unnamed protein product [Mytilus edulis]|uniref:Uncharacterized protein n=1 Tax=Mytilus edulis TaxID=6550 RepID=A0A8S3UL27_MYTED|nr:unnamed protein product [Mytilus edulis]
MVTVSDDYTDDESTNASTKTISCIDIQRYRSLEKAIRVTAYVLRFIQNLRNSRDKRTIGFISVEERCKALEVLIVAAQQQTFKDEIESLNSSSQKKVQLVRQLKLYTDKSGLLRYNMKDVCELFMQNHMAEVVRHRTFMSLDKQLVAELTRKMVGK